MNRKIISILLICCISHSLPIFCQSKVKIQALQALQGTWKTGKDANTLYESWIMKNDHELSGKSYKIRGADTVVFEETRIVEDAGQLSYLAKVRNQNQGKEVPFKLISSANNKFVFENLEHDFPQRVIYQFTAKDSLHAWIEEKVDGVEKREDFYYGR